MLMTFIGRGSLVNEKNKSEGYRKTQYRLPNGELTKEITYIGASLVDYLKPSKVIICGTSGSMWDELMPDPDSDARFELMDRSENHQVTEQDINALQSLLNQSTETEYRLVLLPADAQADNQVEFFSRVSEQVDEGEKLTIDITHGFRFQPLLGFACAQFLQYIKKVEVKELFYAQFNQDEASQVYSLKTILDITQWVQALSQYDHSGDLGVFSPLLAEQGWNDSSVKELKAGAFLERVNNASLASQKLSPLINSNWENPVSQLFEGEFKQRIQWVKEGNRGKKECQLAQQYLKRRDYLRAATFAFEGLISNYLFEKHQDEHKHSNRKEASEALRDQFGDDFNHLNAIRNNLAHGHRVKNKFINGLVTDEDKLFTYLSKIFKKLKI